MLHESTLPGIRSHFVDGGSGTEELDALKRLAPEHSTAGVASGDERCVLEGVGYGFASEMSCRACGRARLNNVQ